MGRKEIIVKHITLIIMLVVIFIWAYTDKGEPYVAMVAGLLEFIYLSFDIKRSRNEKKQKKTETLKTNSGINIEDTSLDNNKGTINFINNSSIPKDENINVSKDEISSFYSRLFAPLPTLVDLQKLKFEIEAKYSISQSPHIIIKNPDIRLLHEMVMTVISNYGLIIVVGIFLTAFLLPSPAYIFTLLANRISRCCKTSWKRWGFNNLERFKLFPCL